MNVDRVLPKDLFQSVSASELMLESSLKIIRVEPGQEHEILPLDPGTFAVVCTAGTFTCQALEKPFSIKAGEAFLASAEDVEDITSFAKTGFGGIIIYVSEGFMINRQRLTYRSVTTEELEEVEVYLRLIDAQISRMSDVRVKIVESLLRALVYCLQQNGHVVDEQNNIPPFMQEFAIQISRFHHSPVYFYAEKLGMTSQELNNKCKQYSNISAAEWISKYVLLESKDLLVKTRMRPSQIATMLNFSSYDTFARWFRRNTGELPTSWR